MQNNYLYLAPLLAKSKDVVFLYLFVSKNASVVLVKDQDDAQHPVYYISKSFLYAETRYSHLEKLILSLVCGSTKLHHYFETHSVCVKTKYSIKNLMTKP